MGGSTAREFFKSNEHMSKVFGMPFYNAASANQEILDSIRLIDNIRVHNSCIIFCIFPLKFMKRMDENIYSRTKYLMGANLKYPIQSRALAEITKNTKPGRLPLGLLPDLNIYLYLLRDFFLHKSFPKNDPIFHYLYKTRSKRPLRSFLMSEKRPAQFLYRKAGYKNRKEVIQKLYYVKKTKVGPFPERNSKTQFDLLQKACDLAKKRHLVFMVFQLPYSSIFNKIYENELIIYRKNMNKFLSNNPHLPYLLIDYSHYKGKEWLFYDHGHVVGRGRNFFYSITLELAKKVKDIVSENSNQ
jgi:hypothetical protein